MSKETYDKIREGLEEILERQQNRDRIKPGGGGGFAERDYSYIEGSAI